MSVDRKGTQPAAAGPGREEARPYEPPRIETLGTVRELTMGGAFPSMPDVSFPGSLSDRRLKKDVAPVDVHGVLASVVALGSRV